MELSTRERGRRAMAMPSTDVDELAKFGYKQELDRSLGLFLSLIHI